MEGEIMTGWDIKARVYPPLPTSEVYCIRFRRVSMPMGVESKVEIMNFSNGSWDPHNPNDQITQPHILALDEVSIRMLAKELVRQGLHE